MARRSRLNRENAGAGLRSVRTRIKKELSGLPNDRLVKYATMTPATVGGSAVLAMMKAESFRELKKRESEYKQWSGKAGSLLPTKKEFISDVKLAAGLAKKGIGFAWKGVTGEAVREFREAVDTLGMKPEEAKRFIKAQRARDAEIESESFSLDAVFEEGQRGLREAKKGLE